MSQDTTRPNLRSRKRAEAVSQNLKGTRKRKARPSITEDELKVKRHGSSQMRVEEVIDLESFESDLPPSIEKHVASQESNPPGKRRKSIRPLSSINKENEQIAFISSRPNTPTQLVDDMKKFSFFNKFSSSAKDNSPLPLLPWADSSQLWEIMLERDRKYIRDSLYMRKHPLLEPRMRAVLLDWLIEVCEVYRLHRETFYLAVDFVDRYLSRQENIPRSRLQLLGVTALFVAAKIEEIYPPKLSEFAYVTDGACDPEEILLQECNLLQVLNWKLSPVTPIAWLTAYLQIANKKLLKSYKEKIDDTFEYPQFSAIHLCRVSELIDISCLDAGFMQFTYSVIAASALYHMWGKDVTDITGHTFDELLPCIHWLSPFARVLHMQTIKPVKTFEKVHPEDFHNIQVHNNGVNILDLVHAQLKSILPLNTGLNQHRPNQVQYKGILTPPRSTEKDSLL